MRLSKWQGTTLTIITWVMALLIFVLLALLVIPTLVNQTASLIETAPDLFRTFTTFLTERFPALLDEGSTLRTSLNTIGATIQERGGQLLETALASFDGTGFLEGKSLGPEGFYFHGFVDIQSSVMQTSFVILGK